MLIRFGKEFLLVNLQAMSEDFNIIPYLVIIECQDIVNGFTALNSYHWKLLK